MCVCGGLCRQESPPITRPLTSLVSIGQWSCSKPTEGPNRLRPESSMISAPKHFPRLQNKHSSICTNSRASVQGLLPEPRSEGTASQTILSAAPDAFGTSSPLSSHKAPGLSFSLLMMRESSAPPGLLLGGDKEGMCVGGGWCLPCPDSKTDWDSCVGAEVLSETESDSVF